MSHAHLGTESNVVQDGGLCLSGGWQYFSAFRGWLGAVHRAQGQKGITDNKPTAASNLTVAVSCSQPKQGSASVCVCVCVLTSEGASSSNFFLNHFLWSGKAEKWQQPFLGLDQRRRWQVPQGPRPWGGPKGFGCSTVFVPLYCRGSPVPNLTWCTLLNKYVFSKLLQTIRGPWLISAAGPPGGFGWPTLQLLHLKAFIDLNHLSQCAHTHTPAHTHTRTHTCQGVGKSMVPLRSVYCSFYQRQNSHSSVPAKYIHKMAVWN